MTNTQLVPPVSAAPASQPSPASRAAEQRDRGAFQRVLSEAKQEPSRESNNYTRLRTNKEASNAEVSTARREPSSTAAQAATNETHPAATSTTAVASTQEDTTPLSTAPADVATEVTTDATAATVLAPITLPEADAALLLQMQATLTVSTEEAAAAAAVATNTTAAVAMTGADTTAIVTDNSLEAPVTANTAAPVVSESSQETMMTSATMTTEQVAAGQAATPVTPVMGKTRKQEDTQVGETVSGQKSPLTVVPQDVSGPSTVSTNTTPAPQTTAQATEQTADQIDQQATSLLLAQAADRAAVTRVLGEAAVRGEGPDSPATIAVAEITSETTASASVVQPVAQPQLTSALAAAANVEQTETTDSETLVVTGEADKLPVDAEVDAELPVAASGRPTHASSGSAATTPAVPATMVTPSAGAVQEEVPAERVTSIAAAPNAPLEQPRPLLGDVQRTQMQSHLGRAIVTHERIEHIAEQLATRLRFSQAAGGSQVQLNLRPRDLGEVAVQMSLRDGVVSATVLVDRPETMRLLQSNLEDLKRSLEQQGLSIQNMSVDVRSDSGGNASWQSAANQQDGLAGAKHGRSFGDSALGDIPGFSGDAIVTPEAQHSGLVSVLA